MNSRLKENHALRQHLISQWWPVDFFFKHSCKEGEEEEEGEEISKMVLEILRDNQQEERGVTTHHSRTSLFLSSSTSCPFFLPA
jgi:hypothetical protein